MYISSSCPESAFKGLGYIGVRVLKVLSCLESALNGQGFRGLGYIV